MEEYIVIAKLNAATKKFEDYQIIKADKPVPEGFKIRFGPESWDAALKFLNDTIKNETTGNNTAGSGTLANDAAGNSIDWFKLTKWQYYLIFLVTTTFVAVLAYGAYYLPNFIQKDTNGNFISSPDDSARVLITFMVAVGTIAIAVLATLTAMVIRDFEKRFVLAKEILTILVGILGTIIGFYFGTAKSTAPVDRGNSNVNINARVTPGVSPAQSPANTASLTPTATVTPPNPVR
jgi:hypothetical protein